MMKKSQILAAIALAFALGVVAPVAGASAIEFTNTNADHLQGEATLQEAKNADSYIRESASYKAYLAAVDAIKGYQDGDFDAYTAYVENQAKDVLTAGNVPVTQASALTSIEAIKDAYDALAPIAVAAVNTTDGEPWDWNANDADILDEEDFAAADVTIDDLKDAIKEAGKVSHVDLMVELLDAIKNDDVAKAQSAGRKFNNMYRISTSAANAAVQVDVASITLADVRGWTVDDNDIRDSFVAALGDDTLYNAYADLAEAIIVNRDSVANYDSGLKALNGAANALYSNNQLAQPGEREFETLNDKDETPFIELADVYALINGANFPRRALWDDVKTAVTNLHNGIVQKASAGRLFYLIREASSAYKEAMPVTEKTVREIMTASVNYTAKTEQDYSQEEPTTSTNPADAPNSGILGTADNSASATISIVAGLATALAALGAGVVAFRSARRSK